MMGKEVDTQCTRCRHRFHAMGPCTGFDLERGMECACEGAWYEEERQISGYCYIFVGDTLATERASHAACPGRDYLYPCECRCHDG